MKNKKLRINHVPQLGIDKSFIVEVENLKEAKKIMDLLANYDLFQYENRIKPDYCNMTVLEEFDELENEWFNWYDEETGIDNLDEFLKMVQEKIN